MRQLFLALAVAGSVALACAASAAVAPDSATPTAAARASDPVAAAPQAPILIEEGGVLRPLANGGRVALRSGWATVRLSTLPPKVEADLVVALFDAAGAPAAGEVRAQYESLDMDHGRTSARSTPLEGAYRVPLSFEMPGAWKILIHVTRGGVDETVTLVLPLAGVT